MGRVPPWLPGSAGGAGEIRNSVDLTQETKRWSATAATSPSRGRGRGAKADVPGNPVVDRNSPRTGFPGTSALAPRPRRSEEHTSELQSHLNLVCRLLL